MSKSESELLKEFGMTSEQVERDAQRLEDENADDGIIGPVYYGLHMLPQSEEPLSSMTIKLPKSQLEQVTKAAKRYHISRSEYVRRLLAGGISPQTTR